MRGGNGGFGNAGAHAHTVRYVRDVRPDRKRGEFRDGGGYAVERGFTPGGPGP